MDALHGRYHTMQPQKQELMRKYLQSQLREQNYENVPKALDPQKNQMFMSRPSFHYRQASLGRHTTNQYHSRSHSQHHYNAMLQSPECNNYCNLPPHLDAVPAYPRINQGNRSNHSPPPPMMTTQHQVTTQQKRVQLDSMTVMRLGAELNVTVDAAPEMPPSRQYSIVETRHGQLYKIPFPHVRILNTNVNNSQDNVSIRKGEPVTVLGPSSEDRSKFTICYKKAHTQVPHQYTQRPVFNWHIH